MSQPARATAPRIQRSAVPSLLLGAAVVVLASVLILGTDVGAPAVVRGSMAPEFALSRLNMAKGGEGSKLRLSAQRGRVVLINFWATWCEPCEREMPAMERLYRTLAGDDFELIAVAIDDQEADVKAFQQRMRLSFPIVLDPSRSVYDSYQTMGVPESLLIDREGRIVE
ncbi:MAG: TlpA disulfide reductase family protein, partial [Myxococcota bacterium]